MRTPIAVIICSLLAMVAVIAIDVRITRHQRAGTADTVARWSGPCKPGQFLTSLGTCKAPLERADCYLDGNYECKKLAPSINCPGAASK